MLKRSTCHVISFDLLKLSLRLRFCRSVDPFLLGPIFSYSSCASSWGRNSFVAWFVAILFDWKSCQGIFWRGDQGFKRRDRKPASSAPRMIHGKRTVSIASNNVVRSTSCAFHCLPSDAYLWSRFDPRTDRVQSFKKSRQYSIKHLWLVFGFRLWYALHLCDTDSSASR